MHKLQFAMATLAILLLTLLASACQPIEPVTEPVAQAAQDEQLQTEAEVLFERAVELSDNHVHVKIRKVTFPVGFKTPEHTHAGPGPRYIFQGEIEVIEAGETNRYGAGEVFWETGVLMTSENVGSEDLVILIVELLPPDAAEEAMTEHEEAVHLTDVDKIATAQSSAPLSVSADATVIDWPSADNPNEPQELQAGTNSWVCRPDNPASPDPDPRCLDENWRNIFGMEFGPEREAHTALGVAYMLQGDSVADNDDPTLSEPPAGQEWQANAPHIMVASPQRLDPALYTNDRNSGGPWVMFGSTPAEHLMVPVELVESQDPADKMADAMSAAPRAIAQDATIIDWPTTAGGGPGEVLREGSNGWVCLPDNPASPDPDSRCLDENWRTLFGMELGPERAALNMIGFAYMLQGDSVADNEDPTATQPPDGQDWQANAPHVMIVSSSPWDLSVFTTDRLSGGPWVMFAGTPAEHLMVPVTEPYE